MARGICDDELSSISSEVAICDINGNALLAFRRKTINEESKIKATFLGAKPPTVGFKGRQLVIKDQI